MQKEYTMNKQKKSNKNYDPNGFYTGKFLRGDEVIVTPPEQDADDL